MSDLISRQAAIEYFMINTNWHDEEGYPIDDAEDKRALLTDYFNGVPSAQPETIRHGHWVEYPEVFAFKNAFNKDVIGCSRCEEVFSIYDNDVDRFEYCPNCGAKMDEVTDE